MNMTQILTSWQSWRM